MEPQVVFTIAQQAIYTLLLVAGPLLVVILAVGVVVSIFQAATQINEATLSFVPKLLAAILVAALMGPWMLSVLVDYLRSMLMSIATAAA